MKLIVYALVLFTFGLFTSGCISRMTPATVSVPIDPAEVQKSRLIDENCSRTFLFTFGPFGDTTIRPILNTYKLSKVTLIDHKYSNYIILQEYCVQVYGY